MELNRKSGLPLHAQAEQLIRELISSEETVSFPIITELTTKLYEYHEK